MTDGNLRGADMGRVLRTFRCWPGPVSITVMLLITVAVVVWQWVTVPDDPLWFRFFVLFLMLIVFSALALPGVLERHRVCEHGLVLGYGPTGRARYVVPWSTVDPRRVRVLRRTQLISRHRAWPTSSPQYRIGTGPLAYRALAVNGLASATTSRPWLNRTSYQWWILGTPRPERLAQAIEEAMIADGYQAHGLAARAKEQEEILPWTPGRNPLPTRST